MRSKYLQYYMFVIVFTATQLYAVNTNPVVTNVAFNISATIVTVTYDVADSEQSSVTIGMQVSADNGSSWYYNYGTAAGDIGEGISTGTGKTIIWTYSGVYNDQIIIRIFANDEAVGGDDCGKVYYQGGSNSDVVGEYYNTIIIGDQCWLKENLNIGTKIAGNTNQTNNLPTNIIEKYCYDDLESNCTIYGGLYQWAEMLKYENGATDSLLLGTPFSGNVQGICPEGWHIPTYEELTTLITGTNGKALKKVGVGDYEYAGTNTSGFTALMSGELHYYTSANFMFIGYHSAFWSSTENFSTKAGGLYVDEAGDSGDSGGINGNKKSGLSIRCLKD